jgi:glycosyltransferase involved in cell wall biosynthesis
MKILVLQSELGVLLGGGENFTRHLFRAFARRGHQVAAAFVADRRGAYPLPLPDGIQAIPLPGWWSMNLGQAALSSIGRRIPVKKVAPHWTRFQQSIGWRVFWWHNRRFQKRVEAEFNDRWDDFDVIYVHSNPRLAASTAKHRPTILRLPGPVSAEFAPMLRSIHTVCANGDALDRIRQFLGDHALELPLGIDERLFHPGPSLIRQRLGWPERSRVVGYAGRLSHIKGVDLLAAAFRAACRTNRDARLLVIGRGEEEKNIRAILAEELSRGRVHIEPGVNQENLADWYRAMDLLVMPSRYENFSNAIMESMACGVPFLAADVGGNRRLADTGAGWLFESGSTGGLAQSLARLLKDGAELRARGDLGSRHAHRRYSWDATATLLETIIETRLGVENASRLR